MAKRLSLQNVFGIATEIHSESYVNRGGLDERLRYLLETDRHVAIHGDSKQGKSWLRAKALSERPSILVQCQVSTTVESLLTESLGAIGVRAEISRTAGNELEGTLDFGGSGSIGTQLLSKLGLELKAGGRGARTRETETEPIGQTPANLWWVAQAIQASGRRLVVEDCHYMTEENLQQLSFILKALGEHGVYALVVGIWAQDHLLTYYNGDLVGRVEDIHLTWTSEELEQVLIKGSKALNITMNATLREMLVEDAYGNVGLIQRLAEQVCREEGIYARQDAPPFLTPGPSLERARTTVAEQMRLRFQAFADNFVRGLRRLPEGLEVYRHLLRAFTSGGDNELVNGIDSAILLERINENESTKIRPSDLTKALERVDHLQAKIGISPPVLTYNRHGRRLFLADRSFLFFRRYGQPRWPWDRGEELAMADDSS